MRNQPKFGAKELLKKYPAIVEAESSLPSLEEPLTHPNPYYVPD
jgi:hypothetical protein